MGGNEGGRLRVPVRQSETRPKFGHEVVRSALARDNRL
jgi:hypothetical protein